MVDMKRATEDAVNATNTIETKAECNFKIYGSVRKTREKWRDGADYGYVHIVSRFGYRKYVLRLCWRYSSTV